MKILFITPITFDSCSFYRSGGIAPDLREKLGIDIDVVSWEKERFTWQSLMKYNLIMMQRPYTENAFSMGSYAKDLGIPLWVDYDDLLLNVPAGNKSFDIMTSAKGVIEKIMGIADVITVTTPELRVHLLKYNENIQIIPNAFNDTIFKKREVVTTRQKIVGWRGSETHLADIMLMGEPLLMLMDKYPQWTFAFLGFNPWFLGAHKNLFYVPAQDPILYFKNIVKIAPYVFHVPLVDNIFNRSKSNIAAIEASYSGSLCIAPDWEGWRLPGILNYKDSGSFYNLIASVVEGKVDVKKNSDRAWEYITDKLMLSKVNRLRADLVKKLLNL
jgi:hypothetical protein